MANLYKYLGNKYIKSGGDHPEEVVKMEYDFANDTGAVANYVGFVAKQKMVVKKAIMKVKTTCTSGGAATVSLGKTGSAAALVAATAVASLTADAIIAGVAGLGSGGVILAADDSVFFDIATAALTAGKIEAEITVSKF